MSNEKVIDFRLVKMLDESQVLIHPVIDIILIFTVLILVFFISVVVFEWIDRKIK